MRKIPIVLLATFVISLNACGRLDPKAGIRVSVEVPPAVAVGQSFEIVARVVNDGDAVADLDSIDIGQSYLVHVRVDASTPPWNERFGIPIDDTESHGYGLAVPARGALEVRFRAVAVTPGEARGAFDICVNSMADCFFERIATRVVVAGAG